MESQTYAREKVCNICSEGITNPICQGCLEHEIITWLSAKDTSLAEKIKGTRDVFISPDTSKTVCILCKNKINVCAYCFVKEVYDILNDHNTDIALKFRKVFNFQIM